MVWQCSREFAELFIYSLNLTINLTPDVLWLDDEKKNKTWQYIQLIEVLQKNFVI